MKYHILLVTLLIIVFNSCSTLIVDKKLVREYKKPVEVANDYNAPKNQDNSSKDLIS